MKWFVVLALLFGATWVAWQVHPLLWVPVFALFSIVVWMSPLGEWDG